MNNISLQELVAYNNTPKAKALIVKYGYRPARSYNDLIHKLVQFTREHREDALKEMAEIHPHKDLILHYTQVPVISETKSNCDGDTMCTKCMMKNSYSNFEGADQPNNNPKPTFLEKYQGGIDIALVGVFVGAILVFAIQGNR